MKKLHIILASMLTLPVYSQTMGTLLLKGEIPSIMSVVIVPETVSSNLPLTQSQTDLKIATINERSNDRDGYSISITSENLGKLMNTYGENLHYTMKYNGDNVNLANGQSFSYVFTNASMKSRDLSVSYTADGNLSAGLYTDTITVTITGN